MSASSMLEHFRDATAALRSRSLYKDERQIVGPQGNRITMQGADEPLVNLCANNYLGLSSDERLIVAAQQAIAAYGYGMSSVRFICGTQRVHKQLERRLSSFLGTDDTLLYTSCFDANTGLFETLCDESDAIISDELNHASIIDGIRLSKARRFRYRNNDMKDLERQLEQAQDARFRLIATDGVFSMDGVVADLPGICDLADKYNALVMVDDSHAVGFYGSGGRGTPEHFGVQDRIDLLTGTLGKALGGAVGGYISGRGPLIEWLRQRSRPYLFSNALPPAIAATSIVAIDIVEADKPLRERLWANTRRFRAAMADAGFTLGGIDSPIVPVLLGDARIAADMAVRLAAEGIHVVAFSYPVVPEGKARIRAQLSAAHTSEDIENAVRAFTQVARAMKHL
jgi:glycine C-acetyltransferase